MLDDHSASFEPEITDVLTWTTRATGLREPGSRFAEVKSPSALPMPGRHQDEPSQSYRPSVISRWIGFGGTTLIYAIIGAVALLTIRTMESPRTDPPVLTVIQLHSPAAPVEEPPKPKRAVAQTQQRLPAPALVPTMPLPPPILPTAPSVTVPDMEPSSPQAETLAPDTIPTRPASQDVTNQTSDSWESRVVDALNKHRRYPRSAVFQRQQGVPYIRFVMNREGRIVSTTLDRSSGHPDLDREALALPKRGEPLPKPPKDKQGDTIELVVPVEFFLR